MNKCPHDALHVDQVYVLVDGDWHPSTKYTTCKQCMDRKIETSKWAFYGIGAPRKSEVIRNDEYATVRN